MTSQHQVATADRFRHFPETESIAYQASCRHDVTENRNQNAIAFDASNPAHHAIADIFHSTEPVAVKLRYAKCIENLLPHFHSPAQSRAAPQLWGNKTTLLTYVNRNR